MNIIFKVHDKQYQFKGSTNDFILYEYYGIKNNKKGEPEENNKFIGYFGNLFQALSHIPDYHALNSEVNSLEEVVNLYNSVLIDIREIAHKFRMED